MKNDVGSITPSACYRLVGGKSALKQEKQENLVVLGFIRGENMAVEVYSESVVTAKEPERVISGPHTLSWPQNLGGSLGILSLRFS